MVLFAFGIRGRSRRAFSRATRSIIWSDRTQALRVSSLLRTAILTTVRLPVFEEVPVCPRPPALSVRPFRLSTGSVLSLPYRLGLPVRWPLVRPPDCHAIFEAHSVCQSSARSDALPDAHSESFLRFRGPSRGECGGHCRHSGGGRARRCFGDSYRGVLLPEEVTAQGHQQWF
jgi:hypothetical protein